MDSGGDKVAATKWKWRGSEVPVKWRGSRGEVEATKWKWREEKVPVEVEGK